MTPMQVLWSGEVQGRGQMRYVEWRGRHWWQVATLLEIRHGGLCWCTTWGEAAYFAAEAA